MMQVFFLVNGKFGCTVSNFFPLRRKTADGPSFCLLMYGNERRITPRMLIAVTNHKNGERLSAC